MPATILIADDTPEIRRYLEFIFLRQGFKVHVAADGPTAIRLAVETHPDVALLDVMMPGMTGLDVCRHMRADPRTAHLAIIMYSAAVGDEMEREALAAGADDFIGKTLGHDALVERVQNLLAAAAGPGGIGPAEMVGVALDIAALLQVDLVWLLGRSGDGRALEHIAAAAEAGERAALSFLQAAGAGPHRLDEDSPLAAVFNSGRPRLDWNLQDLASAPGGGPLAKALDGGHARAACLLIARHREAANGLVVYSAPNTVGVSADYRRALPVVSRYAGLALHAREASP